MLGVQKGGPKQAGTVFARFQIEEGGQVNWKRGKSGTASKIPVQLIPGFRWGLWSGGKMVNGERRVFGGLGMILARSSNRCGVSFSDSTDNHDTRSDVM